MWQESGSSSDVELPQVKRPRGRPRKEAPPAVFEPDPEQPLHVLQPWEPFITKLDGQSLLGTLAALSVQRHDAQPLLQKVRRQLRCGMCPKRRVQLMVSACGMRFDELVV